MSSSSDIEKLFDHFGGDANAYQEIGRENEAHSARTRWPLLVTLDLKQPLIPPIGQRAQARPQPVADEAAALAVERQDPATPKDAASVTRAKAPLFTRSHRRDIPPVVVAAATPAAPRGASRFGAPETHGELTQATASKAADAASMPVSSPVPPATRQAEPVAVVVPTARIASIAPLAPVSAVPPIPPIPPFMQSAPAIAAASNPPAASARTSAAAPAWAQAPVPARSGPGAARTPHAAPAPAPASARTQPFMSAPTSMAASQPTSILGKLFSSQAETTPLHAAAPATQAVPLQSLFDRLRGTPRAAAASAVSAEPAESKSWLVNRPRRS
ncbi:cellulose biosynthesis protein BcsP [Paraburkholderia caledonica]|uniref:cellulose biosynthesis protein BcsP n=1 Tax=Paraburkholderia caledonica TaxID=134536 RepID=UPI0005240390|nr:cellulose biosynthesis protein BcsP [Paraburkholderia caledonica]